MRAFSPTVNASVLKSPEPSEDSTRPPSKPSCTNHAPQSQPATRSLSASDSTPSPSESVPNDTCTLLVGVVRHVRLKLNFPAQSCQAANDTLVAVSVSSCATVGSAGRTGGRAKTTVAAAQHRIEKVVFMSVAFHFRRMLLYHIPLFLWCA